jgi:hypothetical protein
MGYQGENILFRSLTAIVASICSLSAVAQSCDLPASQRAESERYVVAYRTQPSKVAVGQHFAVEFAVCPKEGQPAPEAVRVDGFMPEHNHGMNYRAAVKPQGKGRYLADGLMFHMPGKWDFIFEIRGGGKTERVTHSVTLH